MQVAPTSRCSRWRSRASSSSSRNLTRRRSRARRLQAQHTTHAEPLILASTQAHSFMHSIQGIQGQSSIHPSLKQVGSFNQAISSCAPGHPPLIHSAARGALGRSGLCFCCWELQIRKRVAKRHGEKQGSAGRHARHLVWQGQWRGWVLLALMRGAAYLLRWGTCSTMKPGAWHSYLR